MDGYRKVSVDQIFWCDIIRSGHSFITRASDRKGIDLSSKYMGHAKRDGLKNYDVHAAVLHEVTKTKLFVNEQFCEHVLIIRSKSTSSPERSTSNEPTSSRTLDSPSTLRLISVKLRAVTSWDWDYG